MACGILVSQLRIPPVSLVVEVWGLTAGPPGKSQSCLWFPGAAKMVVVPWDLEPRASLGGGLPGNRGYIPAFSLLVSFSCPLEILWKWIAHRQGVAVRIKCETTWGTVRARWSQLTVFGELGLGFPDAGPRRQALRVSGGGCQGKP